MSQSPCRIRHGMACRLSIADVLFDVVAGDAATATIAAPTTKSYEFIGFGATDVTEASEITWLGNIHGPASYKFVASRAMILSHTPASLRANIGRIKAGKCSTL